MGGTLRKIFRVAVVVLQDKRLCCRFTFAVCGLDGEQRAKEKGVK